MGIKIGKVVLYVLLMMAPAFYFGFMGKSVEMGIVVVAGALTIAFLNLDKF